MGGKSWRQQIERKKRPLIEVYRRKGQGSGARFPASEFRKQKNLEDAVVFLNGWLDNNYSMISQLPRPPPHGKKKREEWTEEWATFRDELLRSDGQNQINLNELVDIIDKGLDELEKAQDPPTTATAELFPASGTQTDEPQLELEWKLDDVYEVLTEHLTEGTPRHRELIGLQDEALKAVLDHLDNVLSGQAPEALTSGERGGEGNDLLMNIEEVIRRFCRVYTDYGC